MPHRMHLSTFAMAIAALLPLAALARAADDAAPAPADVNPDDWEQIKSLLKSSDEEWSVIYPQLWRIHGLRQDIDATDADTAPPERRRRAIFDSPMGGTSLSAPVMPARDNRRDGPAGPFDPAKAPGAPQASGISAALRGLAIRTMINMMLPDQKHPVQTILAELDTLLDTHSATDEQLREKLAALRAVRNQEIQDLQAAQKQLVKYLTADQTAVLVELGLLD